MYLSVQARRAESNMGDEQLPQLVSVARIIKLPIVETGCHLAADVYTRIKKSNSLVSWGLNTAEASLQVALETTLPAVTVLERPITLLDSLLCRGLDVVEGRVPLVTLPPGQIYENTKEYVSSVVVLPVLRRADTVKQFGLSQATSAILRLDNVIAVADKYVDQYLPGTAPDGNQEVNSFLMNIKGVQTIQRADRFSRKLRHRLTEYTVAELKVLRQYSEDALRLVLYTGELLAKDPKALKEKLAALWEDLSKDEPVKQERPANLEQLTVMVTKELARRVVHIVNYSRGGIAALSPIISQSLRVTAVYCTLLADFVVKTTNLDGAKETVIARARIQLIKLQDILKDVNTFTSQLLERIALQIAKKHEDTKRVAHNTHNNGQHSGSNNLNAVD
ncbi:Lipid storage droplets surface-binding protein 1 [Cryptotermes secundus]|nr:lipid storage droplets surface-binding protein 1 isoform X2 [Cryptotermes secundus]XP_023705935.1 lipid storage droplets surface-binding protein 1 isoform X2 [Cryptotermes secundus]PNF35291.1 Lipid storage droplets surface-binding protein 1 [Cryptotermes secundus]PNF35293.1 Lipid storage droplets surface-binding protein 1 [Cryptotermes secundus]PNF35294.1 Lipid storage droplets surface-binding protein 1 [Cryptotermes secundus]